MIDINIIRESPEIVRQALVKRQMDTEPVDRVRELDARRRKFISEVENLKAERNKVSKEIGKMDEGSDRQEKVDAMRQLGDEIKSLEGDLKDTESSLKVIMDAIPNIPEDSVPIGKDESENPVVKAVGEIPEFDFEPKPHWELGTQLGIIDFERGVKISGTRFYVLCGMGARLQRALISWMLDLHSRQGYTEQYTPFIVKEAIMYASGQLPKFVDNLYRDHDEDFWMVPTAEVPITGLHMDEILAEEELPIWYSGYTACFRREKMSAGRDVRGIKRGHQFDKVEMYMFTKPSDSAEALEQMRGHAEETCEALGFPYRVLELCTGDLGFGAQKTYDIEVWSAGCNEWLEVSSLSNVGDFQARRANIRFRPADGGRNQYVHTLNGSGLGMPRTLIAILENNQQEDGSVIIPEVLHPWMGGVEVIQPEV